MKNTITRIRAYSRSPRVRLVFYAILAIILILVIRSRMDFLREGWQYIRAADYRYLILAIAAIAISIFGMAEVMYVLLRAAGLHVGRRAVNALVLSTNAVSATLPGGPPISVALIFRQQLKWGASTVIASWYMVVSGVISSSVMAVIGLIAIYTLGAQLSVWTLITSLILLVVILVGAHWMSRNPKIMERWAHNVARWFNSRRGAPRHRGRKRISETIESLQSVDLPPTKIFFAAWWAFINWSFDWACLLLCLWAVGQHPSIPATIIAFLMAKLVGSTQVTPGGFGPVEATLIGALVAVGVPSAPALAATLIFRMISFVLLAAVGWIIFFAGKRGSSLRSVRDAAKEPPATPTTPPTTPPTTETK